MYARYLSVISFVIGGSDFSIMRIQKLYTYPIKSLRPQELDSAEVTRHGFKYDRRFMVLKVKKSDDGTKPEFDNMHVSHYPEMVLFFAKQYLPTSATSRDGRIEITHRPPHGSASSVELPLEPETFGLGEIEVLMHRSPTKAYRMQDQYNDWLSERFGYEVILAYLGGNYRRVLMSTSHNIQAQPAKSWFSNVTSFTTSLIASSASDQENGQITFSDCAPYLVVSEKSMDDVHNRLPDDQLMDITKFRPNIIVSSTLR